MALQTITHYSISHKLGGGTSLQFFFSGGGNETTKELSVQEAILLINVLRNERPLLYDSVKKMISTSTQEPVGENEK